MTPRTALLLPEPNYEAHLNSNKFLHPSNRFYDIIRFYYSKFRSQATLTSNDISRTI